VRRILDDQPKHAGRCHVRVKRHRLEGRPGADIEIDEPHKALRHGTVIADYTGQRAV
jgi:hypothetical protein